MASVGEPANVIYGLFAEDDPERRIRYVGLTMRGATARLKGHISAARNGEQTPVYNWMRKHGTEYIGIITLEVVDSAARLAVRERAWISNLKTYRGTHGLNMTLGGEGADGLVQNAEARAQMSVAAKARGMGHIDEPSRIAAVQGESNWMTDLSDEDVRAIKELIWDGEPVMRIVRSFGLSRSAVYHISQNIAWLHVPWPIGPRRQARSVDLWSQPRSWEFTEDMRTTLSKSLRAAFARPQAKAKKAANMRGDRNVNAKVTADDVREIRRLREEEGLTYAAIGLRFDIGSENVSMICRRLTWSHVL